MRMLGTYLRPAALQKAVILSEIWNILVWENHTEWAASRWQGASAEGTAAMIQFWTFSKIVNLQTNQSNDDLRTKPEGGRKERERESGPDCTQDHCTNCCTTQVRWQSKAVLGWFACWTTTHSLQSCSMEWNNCEYQYWDKWNFSVYFESLYYRYYSKTVNANIWRLYVQSVYKCHLPDLLKRFLGGVRCVMCGLCWCLGDIILTSVCLRLG